MASNIPPRSDIYGLSTAQKLTASIHDAALLLLLPDPVTCFSSASYNQLQTFRMDLGASAVLLDWMTSGRMSRGEEWLFARYHSVNEVWVGEKRIARDSVLLEEPTTDSRSNSRSLKDRMGLYSCYATLILCGPKVQDIVASLWTLYRSIAVFQQSSPDDLIWSMSTISDGCVVRVAARETESVKFWLRIHLKDLESLVGLDVFSKAFA